VTVEPITKPADGDACCPPGADPSRDSDCGFCGDETIGAGESCDPPDSCPSKETCKSAALCTLAVLSGDADECTAVCEVRKVTDCMDGDDCCPQGCGASDDDDCEDSCGDGIVDRDKDETCEPSNPKTPCPDSCDDSDPCTRDIFKGRADQCNARCSHRTITELIDGDECCPTGANPGTDADCRAQCDANRSDPQSGTADACTTGGASPGNGGGNGAPGSGNGASGGNGAGAPNAQKCREMLISSDAPASQECSQCICDECLDVMMGCYASADGVRNSRCSAIMDCKQRIGCVDDDCYCGSSRTCLVPNGPCAAEIVAASGPSTSLTECVNEPTCANYWSTRYTECLEGRCRRVCRPGVPF
jgi:hypothetical protein